VIKTWTYLLYDEFFAQGDREEQLGLPISFLCDRKTTNIPKSQPGFIDFIVTPIFTSISEFLPGMS